MLILGLVAKPLMPIIKPPLSKTNKENHLKWAANYMKVDFSKVLFTDETYASLDGPNGWSKGWIYFGRYCHHRLRCQQGGGGIMIWAGIIRGVLVGPEKVPEIVKMTAATYIAFLQQNFEPWFKKQKVTLKRMMILMQDNAVICCQENNCLFATVGLMWTTKNELGCLFPQFKPDREFLEHAEAESV